MQTVELAAGRELDERIAEKVMGWTVELVVSSPHTAFEEWRDEKGWRYGPNPPPYSSEIAEAWRVAERFDEVDLHKGPHGWLCRLERGDDEAVQHGEALRAETAPIAICRAALLAVTPA